MGKANVTPRLRNWRAQAVLIVIFLLTLIAAWGTQHYRLRAGRVRLDPPHAFGELTVRCPEGWMLTQIGTSLIAHEPPRRGRFGRSLQIIREHAGYFQTSLEYLTRRGDITRAETQSLLASSRNAPGDQSSPLEFVDIAGVRGVLISRYLSINAPAGRPSIRKQCIACALLASNQAVILRLEGEGAFSLIDHELIDRVAESIALSNASAPATGDPISLGWNIVALPPKGFSPLPAPDRLLKSIRLAKTTEPPGIEIALAPAILSPGDGVPQILSMAMLRDPLFGSASAQQIDDRTWQIHREADPAFPADIFIRRADDGRAVIAEFRWLSSHVDAAASRNRVRELWNELARTIKFEPFNGIISARQLAGASIRQFPDDLKLLIKSPLKREKWQWFHEEAPETASAEFELWVDGNSIDGASQSALTPPLSGNGSDLRQWHINSNGAGYSYRMFRGSPAEAAIAHRTRIVEGVLHCDITLGQLGDARGRETLPRDGAFIPGPLLPIVLGKLPFKPMVIQTDSIQWPEPILAPGLITLYLEPAFDFPRYEAAQDQPMRCWNIQICSTGKTSRWYFRENGEIERIAFPNSLHLHRLEQSGPPANP